MFPQPSRLSGDWVQVRRNSWVLQQSGSLVRLESLTVRFIHALLQSSWCRKLGILTKQLLAFSVSSQTSVPQHTASHDTFFFMWSDLYSVGAGLYEIRWCDKANMITSSIFDSRCFFVPIKFSTVKTLWNWLVSLHIKVLLSRAQYKFIFLELIPVIQLEWTDYRLQFHCDKWQCDWALTLSQASPINCRRAVVCAVQVRAGAPAWIRLIFTMGNSLHPWVPVSPSIGSKDLTCNESCVKLILCCSDFLISFHWLCFGERGKWSVSFCLLSPIAVTPLVLAEPPCLPPQWEEDGRWAHTALNS